MRHLDAAVVSRCSRYPKPPGLRILQSCQQASHVRLQVDLDRFLAGR
jgi:hypothetical protein